jgi:tripartite-type tricarboxylate transporter receptor subunit TctC
MTLNRRHLMFAASAALAGPLAAQTRYPDRPVTLLDPFSAGGNTDYFSRVLAEEMGKLLGQPMIVENKAGGGGSMGAEAVARAKPDGYVLGMASVSTLVSNPALNKALRYDPLADFTLITTLVTLPSATVVLASSPFKTLDDVIKAAKARPGVVSFASPGVGSAGHVLLEHFSHLAGVKFNHVPYRGSGPMQNDLMAGQLDVMSDNIPALMPHIQSGKLRVLATTGKTRLPSLPEVPTTAEAGLPKLDATSWFAVYAPAKTPKPIVDKLSAAIAKVVASPAFQKKAEEQGSTADYQTPAQLDAKVKKESEDWAAVVKAARIEAD